MFFVTLANEMPDVQLTLVEIQLTMVEIQLIMLEIQLQWQHTFDNGRNSAK